MTTYTTIQGDMWDQIAYKLTGSIAGTTALLQSNPDYIEYVIFPAGIVLQVPDFEVEVASDLPPWRTEAEGVE
ncbi:tail protein X [Paenibacillus sp. UASWS1643]|uniref:tail protein X n=1 Tax=Paenibacillus sp. UASWS1643 TaxID=2580422 RepID=UPI00123B2BB2|nr:tail protein X [Paenibacillus sp. UASWS1643]KAA8750092.1 phage tail protein [Paenibacillus sp. UASWS1643]